MGCEDCKEKSVAPVPYIVHESSMARNERTVKRLIVALIVSICLLFASNAAWLWAWMQYDYTSTESVVEYQQDGQGLNIIGDRNTAGVFNIVYKSSEQLFRNVTY